MRLHEVDWGDDFFETQDRVVTNSTTRIEPSNGTWFSLITWRRSW